MTVVTVTVFDGYCGWTTPVLSTGDPIEFSSLHPPDTQRTVSLPFMGDSTSLDGGEQLYTLGHCLGDLQRHTH